MTDQDRKLFHEAVKAYKKKVLASPETSHQFLIELGIITPKGNLRKPYKNFFIKK